MLYSDAAATKLVSLNGTPAQAVGLSGAKHAPHWKDLVSSTRAVQSTTFSHELSADPGWGAKKKGRTRCRSSRCEVVGR